MGDCQRDTDPKSVCTALFAGLGVVMALHAVALLAPAQMWGASFIGVVRSPVWLVAVATAVAAIVLPSRWPVARSSGAQAMLVVASMLVAAGLFWFLRERTHFFGDGYLLIRLRGYSSSGVRAPLLVRLVVTLSRFGETRLHLPIELALALVSMLAGVIAVPLLARAARTPGLRTGEGRLWLAGFAASACIQLFCGHVEYYACLVPLILAYLLVGFRACRDAAPWWSTWLAFGILVPFHLSSLGLLGSQGWIAVQDWRRGRRLHVLAGAAGCGLLAWALSRIAGYPLLLQGERESGHWLAFMTSFFDPASSRHAFGFLTPRHWAAVGNDFLLVVPYVLASIPALWLLRRLPSDPRQTFLRNGALGCALMALCLNREIGWYRDWDTLAPYAVVYVAWVSSRLAQAGPGVARTGVLVAGVLAAMHTLPWIAMNATRDGPSTSLHRVLDNSRAWSPYARGYMHEEFAIRYREQGAFDRALQEYQSAAQSSPMDARYRLGIGDSMFRLGRTSEAVDAYRQAVKFRPDFAAAHHNLATALCALGRVAEAREQVERALALAPQAFDSLVLYGDILAILGEKDRALAAYQAALALRPQGTPHLLAKMQHFKP